MLLDIRISDVRVGEVASVTLQAQRNGDAVLLPVRDICALAELECANVPASDLTLDGVAALLHAHVSVDWGQLTVLIVDCDALPVVRRHARATTHAALEESSPPASVPAPDRIARSPMALPTSLRIGYTMFAASSSPSLATHLLSLGSAALRGVATAQIALAPPALQGAHRLSLTNVSWQRAWYDGTVVRQIRIGDISGPRGAGLVRGISITNTPYAATNGIDSIQLSDISSAGREVEVFRDGTLVAAGHADSAGVYTVWVPSMYGANSITFASYDQFGLVSYTHRSVLVQPGMLPARTLRYSATAGRCMTHDCRNGADLAMSFAPSNRLTTSLSAGVLDRAAHPLTLTTSAQFLARVSDAVSASVTRIGNAATLTAVRFAPNTTLDLLSAYRSGQLYSAQTTGSPSYAPFPVREASISGSWRPARTGVQPSFVAQLSTQHSGARSNTVAHVGFAVPLAVAYVAPFARYSNAHNPESATRPRVSLGMETLVTPVRAPSPIDRSVIRLRMETAPAVGQATAVATLSIPLIESLRLDVQTGWSGWGRPAMSFAIREQIGGVRITSALDFTTSRQPRTTHALDASVLLDGARRSITTIASSTAGTASISGIVFVDQNRNGRFDTGEEPVSAAYVRVGDTGVLSDSAGRYELHGLAPFAPIILHVDPLTLPSPSLVPRYRAIRAEPVPDEILHVDIPIIETTASGPV